MMHQKRIRKSLLTLLAAAALLVFAAVCAFAVPAKPGAGAAETARACRSHAQTPVTLRSIPARHGAQFSPSIHPAEKSIPLLMIVVGFNDLPYEDGYDWAKTVFSGEKSLSAYYSDMSFGKFTFTPAPETSVFGTGGNSNTFNAVNDGVVHVKVPFSHKDWAAAGEYPALVQALTTAIRRADAYVDFSAFDADENGAITENELAVGFVVAGYEGSATTEYPFGRDRYLWSLAWSLEEMIDDFGLYLSVPTPDSKAVSAFIAIAEKLDENEQEPISVLAHELGHYLGLPDLYGASGGYSGAWGKYAVSDFSVMADGCWGNDPDGGNIPYSMDVWSRFALGWCAPQTADREGDYAVSAQSYTENDAFHAICVPTQRDGEYYLLENRQFTKWDAGMALDYDSGGVLVWHIDDAVYAQYAEANVVNLPFHRPAVMPLYPEKSGGVSAFIGNTDAVETTKPFFTAAACEAMFGETAFLDLPLYGAGSSADDREARTLSGLKLYFLDESDPAMTVRLSTADHVHFFVFVDKAEPTCTAEGKQSYRCSYCNFEKVEPIAALGHTEPDGNGNCTRCGTRIKDADQSDKPDDHGKPKGDCKYCGEDHNGFFGFFVKIFHSILALFGLRK